jgi:hypothetical protein
MVLISITPFGLKKIFALAVGLICLSSAACFAQSAFLLVNATPYDHQMNRIQPVLAGKHVARSENLSVGIVNQWIGDLRAIPYGFTPEWKTPAEVNVSSVADCKGKAVALYQKMNQAGAQGVRLVIGKRTPFSRKTHAWLEWSTAGGKFVLDPTINWSAYRVEQVGNGNYVPLYAYSGNHKYRAAVAALYAKN